MAGEYKIRNGLQLDFVPDASGATDTYLTRNTTTGKVTTTATIPASDISLGGNLTEVTSSVLTITGGSGAVLSGVTILVKTAATGQSGYLTSADWNTFNNKQGTALTTGNFWVGQSNIATSVTPTGDVTFNSSGVFAIAAGAIVNADVNNSAAIAFTKMAPFAGTNLVVGTDGSGYVTTIAGFTSTIAGYLTSISSNVQTQLNAKDTTIMGLSGAGITTGAGTNGYAITWDNGASQWTLSPVGAGGSVTSGGVSTDNALPRWNGSGGTSLQNSGVIVDDTDNITGVASITIGTSGLHLFDTDASHDLIFTVGSNLTADRTLNITTGDADRTITLSGNPTLSDWFDQSVKSASSPAFADITVTNAGGLHILDSNASHDLILRTTSDLTADRELIFVTGDATRTLTINASGTLYVTGGTDVSVADGGTGLSAIAALSILVANSANTYVALTPGAGNSLRMNAGGTAWEAYTPSSGTAITVGTTTITSGTSTRIPFNDGGVYAEDSALTWDKTNNAITINGSRIHSTGTRNIFSGPTAGNFTLTSADSVGVGYNTLTLLTDGVGNVAIGSNAGASITTGDENICIGDATGNTLTTGNKNVAIGYNVNLQSITSDGQLTIQNAIFGSGNTSNLTTISSGNIGFFATTWGTSAAKVISIGNGTAPSTSIADGIQLYAEDVAASSELKVRDEAGNITTLSPHNFSLIGEPSEDLAWAYYSERDGRKINVDMLKLARLVEKLSGDKLVYTK